MFLGLKLDTVALCTGGGGAGLCGGESKLNIEDSLMGFSGGFLRDLSVLSEGG